MNFKYHLLLSTLIISASLSSQTIQKAKFQSKSPNEGIKFIENKGQVSDQNYKPRSDVRFYGQSQGFNFHLRDNGVSYQLNRIESWREIKTRNSSVSEKNELVPDQQTLYRTDIRWLHANEEIEIIEGEMMNDYQNFYLPVCPDGVNNVRSYSSITYKNVYNGIDIKWYDQSGSLEYDFILAPGADPSQIRWKVEGAQSLSISEKGELVISTPLGDITEQAPIAWQGKTKVEVAFVLEGDNIVSFDVGSYNYLAGLVIDPVVRRLWGTYYGGTSFDAGVACEVDGADNIYVLGFTESTTAIASTGAHQTSIGAGEDAFLVKFDEDGNRLWGTYYGGSLDDIGFGLAISDSNFVYICGYTESATGIATSGTYQSTRSSNGDGFIAKFSSAGTRIWGSYFGSSFEDNAHEIAIDGNGDIYFTGYTFSPTGLSSAGAHQTTRSGTGYEDAFLTKFSPGGSRIWSTYYGGPYNDEGHALTVDDSNYVYLGGGSNSLSGISTPGCHQPFMHSTNGSMDGFLVKFSPLGSRIWGTYYGGNLEDIVLGLTTDDSSNIYFTGLTYSVNYRNSGGFTNYLIATENSHQDTLGYASVGTPKSDAYLVKFRTNGTRVWGTYLGGTLFEFGYSCKVGSNGNIFLAGRIESLSSYPNIIPTPGSHKTVFNGSGFWVTYFTPSGERGWGTYYGRDVNKGNVYSVFGGSVMALDSDDNIYLTGKANSPTSEVSTEGSYQDTLSGSSDAFLAKLNECDTNYGSTSMTACDSLLSPSGRHTYYSTGIYSDTLINAFGCDSILTVNVTIVATPTFTSALSNGRCDSGAVGLVATASNGIVYWYISSSGGSALDSGNTFTPVVANTATLYAEARDGSCVNANRVPVKAYVVHTPTLSAITPGAVCDSGTVTLSASTSNGQVYWSSASVPGPPIDSGTTFTTPGISTTTNYLVSARDSACATPRVAVTATVLTTPTVTTISEGEVCDFGSTSISATASAGILNWYDMMTGGSNLGTGSSYTTPIVSSTTTYYVDATDSICTSQRVAVSAHVYNSKTTALSETACKSYTSPGGKTFNQSGTFRDTLQTSQSCDSILVINLTINNADTSVTNDGRNLTSNATSATYQWIDCGDNSEISGETNNTFVPSVNGSYAVVVTQNGCTDTSACFDIGTVGISSSDYGNEFKIFPNPVQNNLKIEFGKEAIDGQLILRNELGQEVLRKKIQSVKKTDLNTSALSSGLYYLTIQTTSGEKQFSLIKK